MPTDMSMLPSCTSSPFYKQYFDNCNIESNPVGGKLKEDARTKFISSKCCQEVACRNPSALSSSCVDYVPPKRPHFGKLRDTSSDIGAGVL